MDNSFPSPRLGMGEQLSLNLLPLQLAGVPQGCHRHAALCPRGHHMQQGPQQSVSLTLGCLHRRGRSGWGRGVSLGPSFTPGSGELGKD